MSGDSFSVQVRFHKNYHRNRNNKLWDRIAKMKNNYAVEVYFTGAYPEKRVGPFASKNKKLANRGAISVGEVAQILMVDGIAEKRQPGQIGRTRIKRWKVFEKARARYYKRWRREVFAIGRYIISGDLTSIKDGYRRLGEMVIRDMQRQMYNTTKPRLAENTVKWKGSAHPLFETFRMFNSIRARVVPRV